ncbi:hypothetical protein OEZ86_014348 [Tetradesmus obliquus]|nr:hypothetical protein OEZ86_014348 [Tetradesmus obliquus]
MVPEEMTAELIRHALDGAALVYFDGRLTEAALLLARAARAAGVAVLVEGERLRPGLQELLQQADYVVTSTHFPQEWTGEQCIGDAMLELAVRLPRARMIITTRGAEGSVCLLRQEHGSQQDPPFERCLQDVIHELTSQITGMSSSSSSSSSSNGGSTTDHVCVSRNGIAIQPARVGSTSGSMRLQFSSSRNSGAAEAYAQEAARQAAELNADASNTQGYTMIQQATAEGSTHSSPVAQVFVASAAGLPAEAVADTTGAGDSFIGSVMYGITTDMSPDKIMLLGAVVAACKCTALGARPGLPTRQQLTPQLLVAGQNK